MKPRFKSMTSLTTVALLGLSLTGVANAESARMQQVTDVQVEACVAEIGLHADYGNAKRVVHRIAVLEQRNLEELEIGVETSVYLESDEAVTRTYSASCVTGTMGNLVSFRIDPV